MYGEVSKGKATTESLKKDIHDTTVSLTKEFQKTAERLGTGMVEVRGYLKGLYVAIVPLTIAVLGLMVHLALRGRGPPYSWVGSCMRTHYAEQRPPPRTQNREQCG